LDAAGSWPGVARFRLKRQILKDLLSEKSPRGLITVWVQKPTLIIGEIGVLCSWKPAEDCKIDKPGSPGAVDRLARPGVTGAARISEPLESFVGTYLKTIRFPEPTNPDGFSLLYLRATGLFLFSGYWPGYERSVAAGKWSRRGGEVDLEGQGEVSTDSLPSPAGRFRRTFKTCVENHTPAPSAVDELTGWSLLGWVGPLTYVGQTTVVDPDGQWLPRSLVEVDAWIDRISCD